jgi:hypothetical protein
MTETKTPKGFRVNENGNLQKIPHTHLSKHHCKCGKRIKERLVQIKASIPKLCYRCWRKACGK